MVALFGNIAQWQSAPLLREGLDVRVILFPLLKTNVMRTLVMK